MRSVRWLAGVAILLLVPGVWFYQVQDRVFSDRVVSDLVAIGRLKADQIAEWRQERLRDAGVLMDSPLLASAVQQWFSHPTPAAGATVQTELARLQNRWELLGVLLLDQTGSLRLSQGLAPDQLDSSLVKEIAAAARERRPTLTDLHAGGLWPKPHLGAIAPLTTEGGERGELIGSIALVYDPQAFLYPLVQSWPTPSETAETLLVRRDGEDVLFLNNLRFRPAAALQLRVPMSQTDLPAAQAIRGLTGIVRGPDYRGVDVVAALQRVPDSPWFLVSKIDAHEAFAIWRVRAALIVALILLVVGLLTVGGFLAFQRSQRDHYRAQYLAERRYGTMLRSIGDGVIVTDAEGRVELLNPVAENLTGWTQGEALGRPLGEIFRIVNEDTRQTVENPVNRVLREGLVVSLANHTVLLAKDGTERPIADSGAPIHDEAGVISGVVLVFRDQTEERGTSKALRREVERSRQYLSVASVMMMALDTEGNISLINQRGCELLGATQAELIGRNWIEEFVPADERAQVHRVAAQVLAGELEAAEYFVNRVVTARGEERVFAWHNAVVQEDGQILGTISAGEDITDRHQAEHALRESEHRYRTLTEQLPELIWQKDHDGRYVSCNRLYAETHGFTAPEELVGRLDAELHPPDLAERYQADDERVLATGQPLQLEEPGVLDGQTIWFETRKSPVFDSDGQVIGTIGIARDITDLRQAEEDYRTLFRELRDGFAVHEIILDDDGQPCDYRFLAVNPAFERLTGLRAEDLIGHTVLEVMPGTEAHWVEAYGQVALSGEPVTFEDYAGEIGRYYEVRAFRPALHQFACIFADVTERRLALEQLQASEANYRTLFEHMTEGALRQLPDGTHVGANPAALEMLGLAEEEFLGRPQQSSDWDVVDEQENPLPAAEHPSMVALRTGQPVRSRVLGVHNAKSGERVWLEVSAAPEFQPGEASPSSVLVTFHDVTEQRRAVAERERLQKQLLQAQKMESVGRLAGGVAHDFNNMLSVILGHLELVLEMLEPGHPLRADLLEVQQAAERSAGLTRQLLAFARKQTIAPQVLDLNETLAGLLRMLRRLMGEDIELAWMPGAELWPVRLDPAQIDLVLANLCVNARDAISGVGTVTIETENCTFDEVFCEAHAGFLPGDYVLLAVSDDGCGMDGETLEHAFEPFFTTKEVGEGTGLGLATVYGIVKQNDGFLSVYSEPGRGTTFKIHLPRCAVGRAAEAEAPAVEPPCGQGELVLLVEDDPMVLRLGKSMLSRLGYEVLAAGSPAEAVELAEEHAGTIELLVTDVIMPDLNGRDLAARLKALIPCLKCLYMSGYTADVIAHRGVLDEGVQFIQKPFSVQDLALKVRATLQDG